MNDGLIVKIIKVTDEADGIRSLRLARLDGASFTPFQAGAHIDVTGPTGVLRQYSLASDPGDPSSIVITVKLEPESRGGSHAIHVLAVGDHLRIGKPRNLLAIDETAGNHLLIAGGVGVTPLLAMAYALYQRGADFRLVYFTRSSEATAFLNLLTERVEFRDLVDIHIGLSRDEQQEILERLAAGVDETTSIVTCGPPPFMDRTVRIFSPVVGDARVQVEHFVAEEQDTTADTAFVVELDDVEYAVPADQSILSVLEANGIEVFKSCEEGICGSCVSRVIAGTPDHRDHCLSASDKAAGTEIAICVSRSLSPKLTIELD